MVRRDMAVEASLKSKALYRIVLYLVKVIPMILAGIYLLNTILSYFYIDCALFSFIGGTSLFMLLFMYLTSIVFRFCIYHRMFIHYITTTWVFNIVDYYIGIPLSNKGMLLFYLIITGIFLFLILYFKFRK